MTRKVLALGLILGMLCAVGLIPGCRDHQSTDRPLSTLTPYEAARLWNDSLRNGDVETAKTLTSRSSDSYVKAAFGSIEDLSKRFQEAPLDDMKVACIHTEISGERAVVIYRCQYKNGDIKYWMDTLLLEDSIWRLAPQCVKMSPLKKAKSAASEQMAAG
ncbi:MAG: hypothetical protein ACYS9X_20555 [Planctomycetota bacterium]